MRKRATPSFVFIAPLVGLVLLAGYLRYSYSPEPIALTIDAPRTVEFAEGAASMDLNITLRLENNTDEEAELSAPGECKVLRWYIVDGSDQIIQSALPTTCPSDAVYEIVDAESALVQSTTLVLDPNRFASRTQYFLRVRYWGQEAQTGFRVAQGD